MGQVPFVGRGSELGRLDAVLANVERGCRVVLVSGEPGIGKTRLVHEAVAKARARDALVLEGHADPLGAGNAYAPIVEAVGRVLRALGDKRRAAVVDGLPDLRRLFVGLGGGAPAGPADPQLEKARLFEALCQLVERLTGDGTLVLVLDDLHWADRATFEVVQHLVRRIEDARVVVLATSRSDPADAAEGFSTLLHALRRLSRLDELALSRLGAVETRQIAEGILDDIAPDALEHLLARAGGVPLFVEMLVRGLVEQGRLVRTAAGWTLSGSELPELPVVVRELLAERLGRLDASERRVVDCLAVSGGTTPHRELAAIAVLDEDALRSALVRLRSAALVVESESAGDVAYAAGHPLVLEVAYAALGGAERRALHRRFVEVLERGPHEPSTIDRLARHYRGAGNDVDVERAVRVLVAAGEHALELGADDDAAAHLAGAVALLRPAGSTKLAAVLERLGIAWQRAGKTAAARTVWQEALPLVGDDTLARARLHHLIGLVEYDRGQLGAAGEAYACALVELGDRVVVERAAIERSRAQLFDRIADIAALEGAAASLTSLAEALASPSTRVAAALARTRVHFARDEFAPATTVLDAAVQAADGYERLLLEIAELAMVVAVERGDLSAVRRHAESTLALALRLGSPASQIRAHGYLTTAQLMAGTWTDAERTLQTIATLTRRFGIPRAAARSIGMEGIVATFRGDLDAAADKLATCRALVAELPDDRYLATSLAMGEWWLASERDERLALPPLDAAPVRGTSDKRPPLPANLDARLAPPGDMRSLRRVAQAELAAAEGRSDDALAIARHFAAIDSATNATTAFQRAAAARCEAAALGAAGDHQGARAARARAALAWEEAGMRFEAARDRMRAIAGVEGEHAVAEAQACLVHFEHMGSARWADRARKRLRELGVRPTPVRRPGPGGGPLSKRELEVALAYAEGLSTAQVAERLVISPHTASTHLQRIYQRLGLNSRAALTKYLVDEGLL